MKRLLVAGAGPIFQLARVWRNEEGSDTHAPEFTMLEWYRPGASLAGLMDETEAFLRAVLPPVVRCRGVETSLAGFERVTMAEAFRRWAGADVLGTAGDAPALAAQAGARLRRGEDWEDLFFRLLLDRVEPQLGRDRPSFLTHWPAAQAALARRDPADPRAALRFELFLCGMELANAFEELTDPAEQRARFAADRARGGSAVRPGLGVGRGAPGGAGPRHAAGQRHRARLRPAGDDRGRGGPDRAGACGLAVQATVRRRPEPCEAAPGRRRRSTRYALPTNAGRAVGPSTVRRHGHARTADCAAGSVMPTRSRYARLADPSRGARMLERGRDPPGGAGGLRRDRPHAGAGPAAGAGRVGASCCGTACWTGRART